MKFLKPSAVIAGILLIAGIFVTINRQKKVENLSGDISSLEDKVQLLEEEILKLKRENNRLENELEEALDLKTDFNEQQRVMADYSQSLHQTSYGENGLNTARGLAIVVYKQSFCDYFILENNAGYIVAENMGGADPSVGDKIIGNFHSYGTKDFFNLSSDRDCRLWIDNYMLSEESAMEKIRQHCN